MSPEVSQEDIAKMNMYEKIDEIQTELLTEQFNKKKGYRSKYIPLEELIMKVKPVCREYGVTFYFTATEEFLVLKVFDKKTKEHLSPSPQVRLPALKGREDEGGNYTYLKRYLLMDTFLIIAEGYDPEDGPKNDEASSAQTQDIKETPKQEEARDLNLQELLDKALKQLQKKGLSIEEITPFAVKKCIERMDKFNKTELNIIYAFVNDYFKEEGL